MSGARNTTDVEPPIVSGKFLSALWIVAISAYEPSNMAMRGIRVLTDTPNREVIFAQPNV
jgi:hypothetical protein